MNLSEHDIGVALTHLSELLAEMRAEPMELVVCGGGALIARGFVSRVTRDVDVLALGGAHGLRDASPLPAALVAAATRVAEDLRLPADWLNDGPAHLFRMGLPEGFCARLEARDYGGHLRVHYIGRRDQVFFKLYAATDQGPGRHLADLMQLRPTDEELIAAARWIFTHDPSAGFRQMLEELLRETGYARIVPKL